MEESPNDVLGLAAVAADGTGRIAYVIYDRVRNVAWQAAIRDDDLLGYVMAHEIGHLLLPAGSHDTQGLMRPEWAVRELTSVDVLKLEFSQFQASQIRRAVERRHPDALAAGDSTDNRSLWIGPFMLIVREPADGPTASRDVPAPRRGERANRAKIARRLLACHLKLLTVSMILDAPSIFAVPFQRADPAPIELLSKAQRAQLARHAVVRSLARAR